MTGVSSARTGCVADLTRLPSDPSRLLPAASCISPALALPLALSPLAAQPPPRIGSISYYGLLHLRLSVSLPSRWYTLVYHRCPLVPFTCTTRRGRVSPNLCSQQAHLPPLRPEQLALFPIYAVLGHGHARTVRRRACSCHEGLEPGDLMWPLQVHEQRSQDWFRPLLTFPPLHLSPVKWISPALLLTSPLPCYVS